MDYPLDYLNVEVKVESTSDDGDNSSNNENENDKVKEAEGMLCQVRRVKIPGMTQFQDLSTVLLAKILSYLDVKSFKKVYKTKYIAGDSFLFAERLIPAASMAISMNLQVWSENVGEEIDMQGLESFDTAGF